MTQKTTTPLRFHTLAALALVFFAVFMSALVSRVIFERLPHLEDEVAYLFQAKVFEHGDIVLISPSPRRAFWLPFVLDYTPPGGESVRFGKYTPGYPMLLALGLKLGQAWVINAFFAGLTVALVYRLGSEVFDEDTGLIAAALLSFSPMALLLNASMMNHTSALCFTVLFMYAYLRMERRRKRLRNTILWALLAGFALGMVTISRPVTAIAITLPFAVWSVSRLMRTFIPRVVKGKRQAINLKEGAASFGVVLRPLLIMGVVVLLISSAIPIFNYAATGDPFKNLYTLVWSYDRIGFGEGAGRNIHTLEKGLRHARFDLSLTAADLFGWQVSPFNINAGQLPQLAPFTSELQLHVRTQSNYFPVWGISWLLLPFGIWAGFGRRVLPVVCWWCISVIVLVRTLGAGAETLQNPQFAWQWIIGVMLWINLPLLLWSDRRARWTWLMIAVPLTIVVMQMTYWIGSQLYSTRYFFEGLASLSLLSALPLSWLVRNAVKIFNRKNAKRSEEILTAKAPTLSTTISPREEDLTTETPTLSTTFTPREERETLSSEGLREAQREDKVLQGGGLGDGGLRGVWLTRVAVYGALMLALLYSLYNYSTPRIEALQGFNAINRQILSGVEALREGDRPVLVLVTGPDVGDNRLTWRALATLNTVSSPYLDSDIVVAWNFGGDDIRQQILAQFPDRQVIEMAGERNTIVFLLGDN